MDIASNAPPSGKCWLILHGKVYHVTATVTSLKIRGNIFKTTTTIDQNFVEKLLGVAAATASGYYSLFSTRVSNPVTYEDQAAFAIYILRDTDMLTLNGDVTALARVYVLEWTP